MISPASLVPFSPSVGAVDVPAQVPVRFDLNLLNAALFISDPHEAVPG